jgi:DNA-binding transcriptional LysR family regulator
MARAALSNINLNLLVALDALLQTRSVSDAARLTRVTKSAMSHSLSALRLSFDDPLLVRVGGGMALTPHAEALREPLARALEDLTRVIEGPAVFDPSQAQRRFTIAAPDFLAALLMPALRRIIEREAPGIELSIVPSTRRGNAWMLETGEIDLALGAVVDDSPGIRRLELCTEKFACAARADHPQLGDALTLEQYASIPHLVISLGDDEQPTWIDQALAKLGLERRVAVRVRHFMAAPLIVARTDLLTTAPAMLIEYFARLVPLKVMAPPIRLPTYPEEAYWHERYEAEASHRWLRSAIVRVTSELGTQTRPERTRYTNELDPPKPRSQPARPAKKPRKRAGRATRTPAFRKR